MVGEIFLFQTITKRQDYSILTVLTCNFIKKYLSKRIIYLIQIIYRCTITNEKSFVICFLLYLFLCFRFFIIVFFLLRLYKWRRDVVHVTMINPLKHKVRTLLKSWKLRMTSKFKKNLFWKKKKMLHIHHKSKKSYWNSGIITPIGN